MHHYGKSICLQCSTCGEGNAGREGKTIGSAVAFLYQGESEGLLLADSVEKVGFSDRLNPGTTTTGEPTHHIEWFFGPSVTFAALLLG
ncbi:MAG: hypothetical protein ACRER3_09745 [Pseudomonas fluorescens]